MDGIGKMLRLHAKPRAKRIDPPSFPNERSIEKISSVELQSRFSRKYFQPSPSVGLVNSRSQRQFTHRLVRHPIVVIAVAESQLLIQRMDTGADGCWLTKVERRALDGSPLSGWNERAIYGR